MSNTLEKNNSSEYGSNLPGALTKALAKAEESIKRIGSSTDPKDINELRESYDTVARIKTLIAKGQERSNRKLENRTQKNRNSLNGFIKNSNKLNNNLNKSRKQRGKINITNTNAIYNSAQNLSNIGRKRGQLIYNHKMANYSRKIGNKNSNIKYFENKVNRYTPINSNPTKKQWSVFNMFKRSNPNMTNLSKTLKNKLSNSKSLNEMKKNLNTTRKEKALYEEFKNSAKWGYNSSKQVHNMENSRIKHGREMARISKETADTVKRAFPTI